MHCGFLQAAFLWRVSPKNRRDSVVLGSWLLTGRLAAYLAIGLVLGAVAGTGVPMPSAEVLAFAAGVLLLACAVLPDRSRGTDCSCARRAAGAAAGSALVLGVLTGLKPCPPMLASAVLALRSGGPGPAVLTLAAFFAGSSLFLMPFLFGGALLPTRWRTRCRRLGRVAAAGAAVLELSLIHI